MLKQAFIKSLVLFLSFFLSGNLYAAQWSGIIDPSRAVDWSNAGVSGGIPTDWPNCTTSACNTLWNNGVDGSQVTASNIQTAIDSAPSQTVIRIPGNGTQRTITTGIVMKSNVVVRGQGADQTILRFTGSNTCTGDPAGAFCVRTNNANWAGGPSNTATWSSPQTQTCPSGFTGTCYARGATTITMSNTSNLSVGTVLILDQQDDSSDTNTIYVCGSCSIDGEATAVRSGRGQVQVVVVTAINGNSVTFTPGLYMNNWRSSRNPGAWWAGDQIYNVGIEDLTVDNTAVGRATAVTFFNARDSWVKGITSIYAGRAHVWAWTSARISVRDSYFYESQSHASQSYGIEPYPASDMLMENNIFQAVTAPITVNGPCSGCVGAYNFSIYNPYPDSSNWFQHQYFMHGVGTNFILMEGNVGQGLYSDNFHGSHHLVTSFRNRWMGYAVFGGVEKTANAVPALINALSRYYNFIGNVLGDNDFHKSYQITYSGGSGNPIYDIGNGNGISDDPLTYSTMMRWGNYDTYNDTTRWQSSEVPSGLSIYANAVPSDQNLPASFYLSSQPNWWPSGKPWPPIGPDVTGGNMSGVGGHAYTIPAQDCYANVMGGPANGSSSVLRFNALTCYPSSGGSKGLDAPTNLTIVSP